MKTGQNSVLTAGINNEAAEQRDNEESDQKQRVDLERVIARFILMEKLITHC